MEVCPERSYLFQNQILRVYPRKTLPHLRCDHPYTDDKTQTIQNMPARQGRTSKQGRTDRVRHLRGQTLMIKT